jgi:hypothetical protein
MRLSSALASRRTHLTAALATAAILATVIVVGAHQAYPTTRIPLESGEAWVTSEQIGALTLLDGVAGQTVVNVSVTRVVGETLLAGQSGAVGYALNQTAGQLTRIDATTLRPDPGPQSLRATGAALQLITGTHTLYTVDGAHGRVTAYDPETMRPKASALPVAATTDYTAVVDAQDRLWILDHVSGSLTWFTGTTGHQRDHAFTPGAADLVLANGRPVVVDAGSRTIDVVAPDGTTRAAVHLDLTAADRPQASGARYQDDVLLAIGSRGLYQTCPLSLGACDPPIRLPAAGDTLGPAIAADGRVFIPDYTTGNAWLVDPTGASPPRTVALLDRAGQYELFDRNGLVFFNDPRSDRAGTIAPDGTVRHIVKYAQSTPSASPSTAPTPTGTQHATPSSTTRTGTPSGSGQGPAPTGSASPSPRPTPSPTTTTVNCGDTITASVALAADLTCTGDGLVIGADNVTVDLAGHRLAGNGTGTGITLKKSSGRVSNATIKDGTITRFATGLFLGPNGATNTTINMVTFTGDGTGTDHASIDLGPSAVQGLRIAQVTVTQAGGNILQASGEVGGAVDITGSHFSGGALEIHEPGRVPITLTVTDDSFDNAGLDLMSVDGSTIAQSSFTNSRILDQCDGDGGDTFKDNIFTGSIQALVIGHMSHETITGNHFTDNRVGLYLHLFNGDTGISITGNSFTNNGAAGVLLDDQNTAPQPIEIRANTASGNGASPAGTTDKGGNPVDAAIHIYAPAGGINVSANHTSGNAGYGVWSQPGTATGTGNISTNDQRKCNPLALCTYP